MRGKSIPQVHWSGTKSPHVETTTEHLKSQFKFLHPPTAPLSRRVQQTCGNGLFETYTFLPSRAPRSQTNRRTRRSHSGSFQEKNAGRRPSFQGLTEELSVQPGSDLRGSALFGLLLTAHQSHLTWRKWGHMCRTSRPAGGCWNESWKSVLVPSGLKVFNDVAAVWLTLRKKAAGLLSAVKGRIKRKGSGGAFN